MTEPMSIVDFHNHFFPPEYLEALRVGPTNAGYEVDDDGNPVLHYPGDYNIVVPGHRDIAYRDAILEEHGIARQLLTLTSPGTHIETPDRAMRFARLVNDAFARIITDRGDRFSALATLPLNAPQAAADELERAVTDLGMAGAMLFSNVNGKGLDEPEFRPMYEVANTYDAVLFIHPIHPVGVEVMGEYWLMPLVGFPFDTTLAAAKIVFAGLPARYPRIRWVLGHLGGAIPYIAERLDRGFEAFAECREFIDQPPSTYLRQFYYDTVNFDVAALRLALEFAGADRILAGSDYPHQIGNLDRMRESIDALGLDAYDRAAIFGGNAARLLGLEVGAGTQEKQA